MQTLAVIPARYGSKRFPGKPLVRETGKFLVQHVYEQVALARLVDRVIVATDDRRIAEAVQSFGGESAMTRADHPSGTDRVAEVAAHEPADLIVNVQGDEPEMSPAHIDRLIERMNHDADATIGTLCCPFAAGNDPRDANKVKVVCDARDRALYFSRALIPHVRAPTGAKPLDDANRPWRLHLGIYAYRPQTLLALSQLPPTPLEQIEKLEQLRFLEHGYAITVAEVDRAAQGIDTPEDYAAFVQRANANTRSNGGADAPAP